MSEHITMLADTDDTAPWLSWMLANTQCGLLVLDSDAWSRLPTNGCCSALN